MPRLSNRTPSYRLHRADGRAVVTIDGRDIYLGRYGTPESKAEYDRLIATWLAAGRRFPPAPEAVPDELSVNELLLMFWRQAETDYRQPDGSAAAELDNLRLALRPVKQLCGGVPARAFGPLMLKHVRQAMVDSGLCRRTVNQRVARVVRVFRFGVENELIPPDVHHALKAVPGLRAGRSGAREGRKVRPVADEHVAPVRPFLSLQLWAVVELQLLTGMRSGEVLAMRTGDIEIGPGTWVYTPRRHKTEHRGKVRRVPLGPQAREVLAPWLREDPSAYLFQPREAKEAFQAERRRNRRTPLTPSQRSRIREPRPRRAPGEHYDTRAYNHAVGRACARAGVPRWHPHQLRHAAATRFRAQFGLDVARAILGHSSPAVTELYAAADVTKAAAAVERIG
jgi:integrase